METMTTVLTVLWVLSFAAIVFTEYSSWSTWIATSIALTFLVSTGALFLTGIISIIQM